MNIRIPGISYTKVGEKSADGKKLFVRHLENIQKIGENESVEDESIEELTCLGFSLPVWFINQFPNAEQLSVVNVNTTAEQTCPQVKSLCLFGGDYEFCKFRWVFPNLKHLNISQSSQLKDVDVTHLESITVPFEEASDCWELVFSSLKLEVFFAGNLDISSERGKSVMSHTQNNRRRNLSLVDIHRISDVWECSRCIYGWKDDFTVYNFP